MYVFCFFFFFQAEDGIRDESVTGVQTCALPIRSEEHTSELQSHSHLVSLDRKSTRLNSSHTLISYAVFCLKKKKTTVSCGLLGRRHRSLCLGFLARRTRPPLRGAFFFFNDTAPPEIYPLPLPVALPISPLGPACRRSSSTTSCSCPGSR